MIWMEKQIGEHKEEQDSPLTFPQVRDRIRKKYGIE